MTDYVLYGSKKHLFIKKGIEKFNYTTLRAMAYEWKPHNDLAEPLLGNGKVKWRYIFIRCNGRRALL